MNQLVQLEQFTTIVADTGDIAAIEKFSPQDATTNPSLLLKAVQSRQYDALVEEAREQSTDVDDLADRIGVAIGEQILKLIPGYISTEVDARLSFDREKTIAKARKIISLYGAKGWARNRILIKIASTWEGIQAARQLQTEGIQCNLTLLFCIEQAKACANAKVTLISPFVGRILDWYKANTDEVYNADNDPGVLSVKEIYQLYKKYGCETIVMGASFRNKEEIIALAGCDRLTIAPALLDELRQSNAVIQPALRPTDADALPLPTLTEAEFRLGLNQNAMATEKLAEGIRKFIADQERLLQLLG